MNNQLEVIVKESGLEPSKAKYILEQFKDYFDISAEWEQKAKSLVVVRADQQAEMQMARTGRLFLREKRIAIEKSRKELKEQALREGKMIDGISNVLKALIIPIENYLDQQEHFVEKQQKAKEDAHRAEVEKRMEDDRIAQEKKDAEETERLRVENEKLKKASAKKDLKLKEERKASDDKLAEERGKQEKKLAAQKEKARKDKLAADSKTDAERAEAYAKEKAEREEKERLAKLLANEITCPKCNHKFQRKA